MKFKYKEVTQTIGGSVLDDQIKEIFDNKINAYEEINFEQKKYQKILTNLTLCAYKFQELINEDLKEIAKEEAYENSLKEQVEERPKTNYPLYTFEHGDSEDNWYPKLVEVSGDELKYKMKAFWYEYINDFQFTEEEYDFYKKHLKHCYEFNFTVGLSEPFINYEYYHNFIKGEGNWDTPEHRKFFEKYAKFKE